MANNESKDASSAWPMPEVFFVLSMDGSEASFREVSGLGAQSGAVEYRAGNIGVAAAPGMPGVTKTTPVTLKYGMLASDSAFLDWYKQITMNTIKTRTVTISLKGQGGAPKMVWKLSNAWPSKMINTDLNARSNEVAVEAFELVYEDLSIENE